MNTPDFSLASSVRSKIALARGVFAIILDGLPLFLGGDFVHQPVFRRKHHVSRAEQGVGPRGEDADF